MAIWVFLTLFAEQNHLVVQEEVPLHGLEACQVFYFIVTFFMVCPHVERALHEQLTQVIQITLDKRDALSQWWSFDGTWDTVHLCTQNMQQLFVHIVFKVMLNKNWIWHASKPVIAIWCIESLTDFIISSMVAKASSSSAVPSEFLLHFSISYKSYILEF